MRTVSYQSVLWGTARLLGMNPARDLNTDRAGTLTEYINRNLITAWRFDWWPEFMECERRQFRPTYSASENITATTERYHIATNAYYQALRAQTPAAQAPATAGVENSAWWAVCRSSYAAADQVSGETLAVGAQRRDANTGLTYQVFTAHTTASTTVDTSKAGLLTAFARYISFDQTGLTPIGTVKGVHQRDPLVFPDRSGKYDQMLNNQGVVVLPGATAPGGGTPNLVWVQFRRRPPVFTSTLWVQPSAGNGYALNALVYSGGETYKSLIAGNEDATTVTASWSVVSFPEILAEYCKLAAAGDCSTDQKQNDRSRDLRDQAQMELERVREQEIASQQSPESAEVMTYGR